LRDPKGLSYMPLQSPPRHTDTPERGRLRKKTRPNLDQITFPSLLTDELSSLELAIESKSSLLG
jgi:hypothetical protein